MIKILLFKLQKLSNCKQPHADYKSLADDKDGVIESTNVMITKLSDLDNNINNLGSEFNTLTNDINTLDSNLQNIEGRLTQLEHSQGLNPKTKALSKLEQNLSAAINKGKKVVNAVLYPSDATTAAIDYQINNPNNNNNANNNFNNSNANNHINNTNAYTLGDVGANNFGAITTKVVFVY